MSKSIVSIVSYEKPFESVKKAIKLSGALEDLPLNGKFFIKPNIVFWNKNVVFPKWGVITTSRIVEDTVRLLKEMGAEDITIGEGSVVPPDDRETPAHAFESLGYNLLKKKYGVKVYNILERPFVKVDMGEGIELSLNKDAMESDLIISIPVMKTHSQTVVSLACKNLKGLLDINSRKKCHSTDPEKDLNYMISLIPEKMPPTVAIIDGIYTNEIGPMFGNIRRSNILIASKDILSADIVGAKVLGHTIENVPHIANLAKKRKRPGDLSDIEIKGEKIEEVTSYHEYAIPYSPDGNLSMDIYNMGVRGLTCRNPGLSICTYCVGLIGLLTTTIGLSWDGILRDDVEILSGKTMKPAQGKKKTILLGKCMCNLHKDNPDIEEALPVKGCPPSEDEIITVLQKAGININPVLLKQPEILLGSLMGTFAGRDEFDETFFKVKSVSQIS